MIKIFIFLFHHLIAIFTLLVFLLLPGCALIPKSDNCETSCCKLEPLKDTKADELIINQSKTIDICACRPWNKSGIQVKTGQQFIFEQVMLIEKWKDGKEENGFESSPDIGWKGSTVNTIGNVFSFLKRSDQVNWYALVGTVDKDDEDSFAVFKESEPVLMNKYGELYFYANDMKGRYFNNRGLLRLKITKIKDKD